MPGIFISYRRADSPDAAGRIYDRLVSDFGRAQVFKDVDSIPLGQDFRSHLNDMIAECAVVLVVIGPHWSELRDESGQRRLESVDDFVRIEIEAALARSIPVVPVLVGHAIVPTAAQLPSPLAPLAYRQAIEVRPDPDFHHDATRLVAALRAILSTSAQHAGAAPSRAGKSAQSALSAGMRLGAYEILVPLGAGGMGEVYRARDTKLQREVAIKVLPASFASNPERLARFEREARMLAALNHPHIGAIYGLEEHEDIRALVLELIEGETLAERLLRGPAPLREAIAIARQIAEALEAAHEQGIIHRDLKPANIQLKADGSVKVLDFGIAKAMATDSTALPPAPTLTVAGPGVQALLGTAAYMSPEQARGHAVDKRTDIWAFGCVLYEMLSGRAAFSGPTVTDTLAALIEREPDWSALPPTTPGYIRRLLVRAMEKDPRRRLRDMGDARAELEDMPAAEPVIAAKSTTARRNKWAWVAGTACLITAGLAGVAMKSLKTESAPPAPVSRSVISLKSGERIGRASQSSLAISPDGSRIVFAASKGDSQQLYLRPVDSFEAKPLPGTEGAGSPFFSPDGQWIGFFADAKLKKVHIDSGAVVTLCAAAGNGVFEATWDEDTIVFQVFGASGLWRVAASGGTPRRLIIADDAATGSPAFLPGRRTLLYAQTGSARANLANAGVALYRMDTNERRSLIPGGTRPAYSPTGHLLYLQGSTLMAAPFDGQQAKIFGAPVPMVEGVSEFHVSRNGSLVYVPTESRQAARTMVWVERGGREAPLPAPPHDYSRPSVSPDGKRVAVTFDQQVGIYDLAHDTMNRLTFEASGSSGSAWTPDGKRLAFASGGHLYWQSADGNDKAERLTTFARDRIVFSWSPNAQELTFAQRSPDTGWDSFILRLSDRKEQAFLQAAGFEGTPQFSPDGRWIAYISDESGRFEIYVQPYPGPGGKRQVSTSGGTQPVWNPNGRELFFVSGNKMMAAEIATQPVFQATTPKALFENKGYQAFASTVPNYGMSPDGQHFLMIKSTQPADDGPTQIHFVQNWFEELKRKVPTEGK